MDGVNVSSTFSSGMLVRLGQSLGELLHPAARAHELPVTRILAITNAAFLAGAIAGGVLIESWGNLAILVPALALATDRAAPRPARADRVSLATRPVRWAGYDPRHAPPPGRARGSERP